MIVGIEIFNTLVKAFINVIVNVFDYICILCYLSFLKISLRYTQPAATAVASNTHFVLCYVAQVLHLRDSVTHRLSLSHTHTLISGRMSKASNREMMQPSSFSLSPL